MQWGVPYADDAALTAKSEEVLEQFFSWKTAMESKGLLSENNNSNVRNGVRDLC